MTFAELEERLPNGFHDSALRNLAIDYQRRTLLLEMSISIGLPDDSKEHRDDYRPARIEFSGVIWFSIDPPQTKLEGLRELWIVDAYESDSILKDAKGLKEVVARTAGGAFARSFFVNDWNSYIHVAAQDCKIEWLGETYSYSGPRQHFLPGESTTI